MDEKHLQAERRPRANPRRLRGWRRLLALFLVNVVCFGGVFLVFELAIRWYREGSFGAAITSFGNERPVPRDLGIDDWLVPHAARGYALNPKLAQVNRLKIRHGKIDGPSTTKDRVLVMGDSVIWDKEGFVTLLGRSLEALGRIELINAAVPGYTTYQEALLLDDIIDVVRPRLVLLQYCLNDHHRFLHRIDDAGTMLMTTEARQALLPEGRGLLGRLLRWSYIAIEVRRRVFQSAKSGAEFPWEDREDFGPAWKDDTWASQRELLVSMKARAESVGASFAVVLVPFEPQLDPALLKKDRSVVLKPQRLLDELCRDAEIPFLDLFPAFVADHSGALFRDQVHLTGHGHRLAFETLREFLHRRRLLPGG